VVGDLQCGAGRLEPSERLPVADSRDTNMQLAPKAVVRLAIEWTAAWNSKSAVAVASAVAKDGEIVINRGELWNIRRRIAKEAAGFFADLPAVSLTCEEIRCAGSHTIYVRTLVGHDAKTGNSLKVQG
jgi:uncharacterized protein (TIGR02246 family)